MSKDYFEMDPGDDLNSKCGIIFSTIKGSYVFACAHCDKKYRQCEFFLMHLAEAHIAEVECKPEVDLINISLEDNAFENDLISTSPAGGAEQNDPLSDAKAFKRDPFSEEDTSPNDLLPSNDEAVDKQMVAKNGTKTNLNFSETRCSLRLSKANVTAKKCGKRRVSRDRSPISEVLDADPEFNQQSAKKKNWRNTARDARRKIKRVEKIISEVTTGKDQIQCLQCPAIFSQITEFRNHMETHESTICPRCSRGFQLKHKFDEHMTSNRQGQLCTLIDDPIKCHLCDFGFAFPCDLRTHLHRHFDSSDYQCSKCSAVFKTVHNLKKHEIRHSEQNKKFHCESCPQKYCIRNELMQHVKRVHTGYRPYLCAECGAVFPMQSRLLRHRNTHHAERKRTEECQICRRKFFDKERLRLHKLTHSEERKYACSVCNATFKFRGNLTAHLKIHENKRQYQCQLCHKGFNQHPGLLSHMKSAHADRLS